MNLQSSYSSAMTCSVWHFPVISTRYRRLKLHRVRSLAEENQESTTGKNKKSNDAAAPRPKRKTKKITDGVEEDSKKKSTIHALKRKGLQRVRERSDRELFELETDYNSEDVTSKDLPPLICCIGSALNEFVPTVRVSERQMHPDIYSSWVGLQWEPPEFARAPGGPPSNMAIALTRMGNRAAFMGMVGDDPFGFDTVERLRQEKVDTRGVRLHSDHTNASTGVTYMKLVRGSDERFGMECVQPSAEDCFQATDINVSVLKEAKILLFNAMALLEKPMYDAVLSAIKTTKEFGGEVFFDLNLPMPLWKSRDETRELIMEAWKESNAIEVTIHELDFLLDETYYFKQRNYEPQYAARSAYEARGYRRRYHYTRKDLEPLWHDNIRLLIVTDGTHIIHYYTPTFDGEVRGTEDVLVAHPTCDRTGSGDAVVAAMIRKLTTRPELYDNQDKLERQIRFAISAGIIAQWAIGASTGLPTERAAQNLKESVFVPSLW